MSNLKNALMAATLLLAVPHIATAQPITGLYMGGGGGLNFMEDQHIKASSLPAPFGGVAMVFQPGWAGVASVGYGFGNGFRIELEGNYRSNHPRSQYPVRATSSAAEEKYGSMFNVLYDFNLAGTGTDTYGVTPYLGIGAGLMHNSWSGVTIRNSTGNVKISNSVNDMAFQGIAGLAYPVSSVPGLSVTMEYRVVDEPRSRNYSSLYVGPNGNSSFNSKVSGDLNHSALIGLRYALNTPVAPSVAPAAAPPAPMMSSPHAVAPAPARSYLVFFDWDRADLSSRAMQILADAAQNSTKMQYTKIDVQGHADLSGTHAYNKGLSLLRANAVAGQLVKNGVPETAIVITALGDTQPLVPTAPGVREPQNRRVEIMIR